VSQPRVQQQQLREFITRFLSSVEHLEIFIALQKNTLRWWSARDMAAEMRLPESTTADVLEQLASGNFLAVRISNDILYRFNPATDTLRRISGTCADLYVRDRISLISLLTSATIDE
jgi:hypothetical protein